MRLRPTKGMSPEALAEEIRQRKLDAFDRAIFLSKQPDPSIYGMKSPFDAILYAHRMNEARIKDFEKNNPS